MNHYSAAGWRHGSSLYDQSSGGYYWSPTVAPSYSDCARRLYYISEEAFIASYYRRIGQSVRAVLRK